MESCAEYIRALNASISLFLRVLCAKEGGGRKNEFEGNKISVRIRGKKVGEKKKKKRNCAEERYTDLSIALLVKIISS